MEQMISHGLIATRPRPQTAMNTMRMVHLNSTRLQNTHAHTHALGLPDSVEEGLPAHLLGIDSPVEKPSTGAYSSLTPLLR